MIDISQKDFEDKIRLVINGETTRVELIKELKTDRITLNNKIQELSVYNPELYFEFITRFPFRPRTYSHIDYEAMMIDILKRGYTSRQCESEYEISRRTIKRNFDKIVKKQNPELYNFYTEVMYYRKHQYDLPEHIQLKIDSLTSRDVFIGGICDKREEELLKKEEEFVKSRLAGLSDTKAHGSERSSKTLSTLYRIELERITQEKNAIIERDSVNLSEQTAPNNKKNPDIQKIPNTKSYLYSSDKSDDKNEPSSTNNPGNSDDHDDR